MLYCCFVVVMLRCWVDGVLLVCVGVLLCWFVVLLCRCVVVLLCSWFVYVVCGLLFCLVVL